MKIVEQLSEVQAKLKAPKGQYNQFGKYNYRSCEDILEAVKPLLKDQKLTLILDDSIESVGNRVYVKAMAKLQNSEGESVENHAFAREAESKKGMDESQITGTASSYARKYALNGLFLIDDAKDADTDQYAEQGKSVLGKPTEAENTVQATSAKHHDLFCDNCGDQIHSLMHGGKHYSAQEVADKWGLCVDCLKKGVKPHAGTV